MHLSSLLDFDVIPLEADDAVTVLLDVTAPEQEVDAQRPPATLQVVLDRSGSMGGARLEGAVRALLSLVDRLAPGDNFGLVSFDNSARVEVPAGPLTDKDAVRARIAALRPGGSTDLSSGLMRGIQEARRVAGQQGATLLLISDGHANQGITDHDSLNRYARGAYGHGVTTTTLGYGLGYDEALLGAVADGGAGSALFAEDPDTAGDLIAREADYLLSKTAQAVSLTVRTGPLVGGVGIIGEMPAVLLPEGAVSVDLGDFYSGEQRRLLFRFDVPGAAQLGPLAVAELECAYVDPVSLDSHTATLPITVNVVPGDAAADRVPAPEVRTEQAFQRAQTAKREASEALRDGDREQAAQRLSQARQELTDHLPSATAAQADEVSAQIAELDQLARRARSDDAGRTAKAAYASQSGYSRKRSRMAENTAEFLAQGPHDGAQGGAQGGTSAVAGGPRERALASLDGLSVGDAFGMLFFGPKESRPGHGAVPPPPWRWTGGTETACSVVAALDGGIDQDALARLLAERWDPDRGYGHGTSAVLGRIRSGVPWREAAARQTGGTGSFGNGAAMRSAPIGAYHADDPARAAAEAALAAEVTHAHPDGIAGASAVAAVAAAAAGDPALDGAGLIEAARAHSGTGPVRTGLDRAAGLLDATVEHAARELGHGARATAPDTVPFALWAAAVHRDDFAAALWTCVRARGDMNTTAAIAGGVITARLGTAAVPAAWHSAREPLPHWLRRRPA
ncbi:ADP-ribosylglycohydrolase [Murinocardiopsis flavida]|uniref:ADP-ribosylglycohydrolase n=1 Tax=Murinocardiopsis flavida TaxID=645275 RepID=A0A2P8DRR1_9ACTN|nr:ADP-ribosylglycohydrolase family protein [Murinocardiopsis flavida]PSK99906.1 ADP-ribosylglycohydrolase [Murinocardiopsis flavida]